MSSRDLPQAQRPVRLAYERLVETGAIRRDDNQRRVASALDGLVNVLSHHRLARKSSALGWLFARKPADGPKGLYIHGGVGTGKTMLMDLFFAAAPTKLKRRAHFIDFMADAQDRIQAHRAARTAGTVSQDDPIPPVAAELAAQAELLCFDEFSVTDIADAMILSRLFSALFARGVVLVATSNVSPDVLYRDGLNRALFLPFVDLLKSHATVVNLDSGVDYRRLKLATTPVYLTPLGPQSDRAMDEAWMSNLVHGTEKADAIAIKGRQIVVPRASGRSARFTFEQVCGVPLGARDYLAIAERYDTIFVDGIPRLDASRRNEAKRLILLVDALYDRKRRLNVSAAAPPEQLYEGVLGTEGFEFARTASRLVEMQSAEWLAQTAGESTNAAEAADAD